ncbi:TRAP transporter small permease [Paracoccaceae bacterium GXU_MW_L88]
MSWLTALSNGLVRLERWASRLLVLAFVGLIVVNVAMRYVIGRPMVFAEELAAILLVWLAFTATSITIHDRTQIGVTLVTDLLSERLRRITAIVTYSGIALILAVLLWSSIKWVNSPVVAFEQIITTGWPKSPFFWIVPIFSLFALIHVAADLANTLAAKDTKSARAMEVQP